MAVRGLGSDALHEKRVLLSTCAAWIPLIDPGGDGPEKIPTGGFWEGAQNWPSGP